MSDHSLNPTPAGRDLAERTARLQRLLTCRLTTAEILYHMPDHPALLQSYVWQDYDLAPKFPGLQKFLGFWESSLDGRSEEHTSELQSLMRISYAVFCLKKKKKRHKDKPSKTTTLHHRRTVKC